MGQQQLLLVILVTIIVGIATVVAINTFSAASDSANVDAVRNDLLSIASSAQQYYMKPEALGGGGNAFDGITANNLGGVPGDINSDTEIQNSNGTYTLPASPTGDDFVVSAEPQSGGAIAIRVCADDAVMGDYDPDASTAPTVDACPAS
ncbi:hypothetical protein [Fodinibius halophilus]|uniref:Type II secretion system protein n=1 Tax=Fodinibius halophilus TaxID=1736908 RepID=A0A6M1SWR6_9BACT|nr:hypothetical protein [Fodinibius halophilus]NGP87996.1 hypothetical protein [Fodinibius halophilus]